MKRLFTQSIGAGDHMSEFVKPTTAHASADNKRTADTLVERLAFAALVEQRRNVAGGSSSNRYFYSICCCY
ncbi:MAG: hypothetical protein HC808_18250 [Candidatus Competibacteraceae bacterium]|nr:hypothetical protein [Candidatus Competibacteraceae bacterium]